MFGWLKSKAAVTPAAGRNVRRFNAAVHDRLTASWLATNNAIDKELRRDLDQLRARSRDLFKNNEYAKRFGRMVRNNVVGAQGFTLMSAASDINGSPDRAANAAIELAWLRQCRPGNFEVTGKLSGEDSWRLAATALARDGEVLMRVITGAQAGYYGWQLQLIDIDRLDTQYNVDRTGNSNAVVMGVEIDQYRRPVAYHINFNPFGGDRQRERIPAAEILHCFVADDFEQTRGYPWAHAAMRRLNDLDGYREAAVIAARVGASKMGIWETPDGEPPPGAEKDDLGNYVTSAEPGHFDFAPAGYKLHTYDPTYPHDQFDSFCKEALRGISSALGVAYHGLSNNLEGVNFSSIRSGVLEEREEWMVIQAWFTSALLVPVYERWLAWSLLNAKIKLPNGTALPSGKVEKFSIHAWQGRRWAWVDPMKDIQASILAIEAGLASPQQIAAQSGRDVEDVLDEIQRFQQLLKERGITLAPAPSAPQKPGLQNNPPDDGEDPESDPEDGASLDRAAFNELRAHARSLLEHAQRQTERPVQVHISQEPAHVHITQADTHVHLAQERAEPAVIPAPIVNVSVEPTPVTVNVQPAQVTVEVEATLPAPDITVHLPPRKTETTVERDGSGRITTTTQLEEDA